jgi:beta-glucosidase
VISSQIETHKYNHSARITVTVANIGKVAGAEVAQLYLQFPESAGEPQWQLKGFEKTELLAPGASVKVRFDLVARDFSIWDVQKHGWSIAPGTFVAAVGASSRDHRLAATL